MYHVYEYEATTICPECCGQETVPVAAYINEDTGKETLLARRTRCGRHGASQVPCGIGKPVSMVTEIKLSNSDAYRYMAEKIRRGYDISHIAQ